MGTHEITWNEFELFMYIDEEKKFRDRIKTDAAIEKISEGVARPTKPYVEMSFGMGKDGYPAISMTQHAANKYCQWLSAKTGHFYRLPTEAEWEYAARAGTKTAYSWGDNPADAKQYAWFEANSDFKYQKVGRKQPNPWGLYDMHGNVAEWCIDQYEPSYDKVKTALLDPCLKQSSPYPQVARGGSWDDGLAKLRSAARRGSDKSWKQQDPQLPKSMVSHRRTVPRLPHRAPAHGADGRRDAALLEQRAGEGVVAGFSLRMDSQSEDCDYEFSASALPPEAVPAASQFLPAPRSAGQTTRPSRSRVERPRLRLEGERLPRPPARRDSGLCGSCGCDARRCRWVSR
jgi:hypothetical protein